MIYDATISFSVTLYFDAIRKGRRINSINIGAALKALDKGFPFGYRGITKHIS